MPYVEGESLRDRLERDCKVPVEEAIKITDDIAAALSYAHDHGIVHRDVKPEKADLSSAVAKLSAVHAQDSHTFDTHSGATGI